MVSDVQRWNEYHQNQPDPGRASDYAVNKENEFPRGSYICDLGGGTGLDAVYFLKKGHKVIILDISDHALKIAQSKAKSENVAEKLTVKQVDYWKEKLPLPDASCDIVYSRQSLHYFPANEMVRLIKDVYRLLKPGGKAYITLKSPEDISEMVHLKNTASEFEPNVFIKNEQLKARFTVEQLKGILVATGIPDYSLNPIKEKLANGDELALNEITLTKV